MGIGKSKELPHSDSAIVTKRYTAGSSRGGGEGGRGNAESEEAEAFPSAAPLSDPSYPLLSSSEYYYLNSGASELGLEQSEGLMWSAEEAQLTESSLAEDSKYLHSFLATQRKRRRHLIPSSTVDLAAAGQGAQQSQLDTAPPAAAPSDLDSAIAPDTKVSATSSQLSNLASSSQRLHSRQYGGLGRQLDSASPPAVSPSTPSMREASAGVAVGSVPQRGVESSQPRTLLQSASDLMHESPVRLNSIPGSFRSAEYGLVMSDPEQNPTLLKDLCQSWLSELKSLFKDRSDDLFSHCSGDVRAVLPWSTSVSLCDPASAFLPPPPHAHTRLSDLEEVSLVEEPHVMTQQTDPTSRSLFITAVKFVLEMLHTSEGTTFALEPVALQRALQTVIDMAVHLPVCCFSQSSDNSDAVLDNFFLRILYLLNASALSESVRSAALLCGILLCCLSGNPIHVLSLAKSTSIDLLLQEVDAPLRLLAEQKLSDLQNSLPCIAPCHPFLRQCFQVAAGNRGLDFDSLGIQSMAVSFNGAFIFAHGAAGILKIGTGKLGSVPGHVYAWRRSFYSHDPSSSICCISHGLLYRSASIAPAICIILDAGSLDELGRVHSDGTGSWRTKDQSSVSLLAPAPAISPRHHHASSQDELSAPSQIRAPSRARARRKSHQRSRSDETQRLAAIVRIPNAPSRLLDSRDSWQPPKHTTSGTFISNENQLFLVYARTRTADIVELHPETFDVLFVASVPFSGGPSFDDLSPIHITCNSATIIMLQLSHKGCKTAQIPIRILSERQPHPFQIQINIASEDMWMPLLDAQSSCSIAWDSSESRLWCSAGAHNLFAAFSPSEHPLSAAPISRATTVSSIIANILQLTCPRLTRRLVSQNDDFMLSATVFATHALAHPACVDLGLFVLFSFAWLGEVPTNCIPRVLECISLTVPESSQELQLRLWVSLLPLVFKEAEAVVSWITTRFLHPLSPDFLHEALLFLSARPTIFVQPSALALPPTLISLLIHLFKVPLAVPLTAAAVDFVTSLVAFAPALIVPIFELFVTQVDSTGSIWGSACMSLFSRLLHLAVHTSLPQDCWRSLAPCILRLQSTLSLHSVIDDMAPKRDLRLPRWFSGDYGLSLRHQVDKNEAYPETLVTHDLDMTLSPASGTPAESNSDSDPNRFVHASGPPNATLFLQTAHPLGVGTVEFSMYASILDCTGMLLELDPRSCTDGLYVVYTQSTGFALPMRVFADPGSRLVFVPCDCFILKFSRRGTGSTWGFRISLRPYRTSVGPSPASQFCAGLAKCATSLLNNSAHCLPWETADHPLGLPQFLSHPLFRNISRVPRPNKSREHDFCHEIAQRVGLGARFLAWRSSLEQDNRVGDDSALSHGERVALACILWHCRLADHAMKLSQLYATDPNARITATHLRENGIALTELVRACHAVRVIREGNVVENVPEMIRRGLLLLNLELVDPSTDRQSLAVFILDFLLRDSLTADTVMEALKQISSRDTDTQLGIECYETIFHYGHRFWGHSLSDEALALASWCALAAPRPLKPNGIFSHSSEDIFLGAETCALASSLDPVDAKRFIFSSVFGVCTLDAFKTPLRKLASFQTAIMRLWLSSSSTTVRGPPADFAALMLRLLAAQRASLEQYPLFAELISKHNVCDHALDRMESSLRLVQGAALGDVAVAEGHISKNLSAISEQVQLFRARFWDSLVIVDIEAQMSPLTPCFNWRTLCRAIVLCPAHFRRLLVRAMRRCLSRDFQQNMLRDLASLTGQLNFASAFPEHMGSFEIPDPHLLFKTAFVVETILGNEEPAFDDRGSDLILEDPLLHPLTCASYRPSCWGATSLKNATFDCGSTNRRCHVRSGPLSDACEARLIADRAVNDSAALVYWEIQILESDSSSATWSTSLGFIDCSRGVILDSDGALPEAISQDDVIGCGWIPREGVIFFTFNGVIAPETVRNARGVLTPFLSLRLLGRSEDSFSPWIDFQPNFGESPFALDVGCFAADPRSFLPNCFGRAPVPLDTPTCWMPCAGLIQDMSDLLIHSISEFEPVKVAWQQLLTESLSSLHAWIQSLNDPYIPRGDDSRPVSSVGSDDDEYSRSDDDAFNLQLALSLGCVSVLSSRSSLPLAGCIVSAFPGGRSCLVIEAPLSNRSDAWIGLLDFKFPAKLIHVPAESVRAAPRAGAAAMSLNSVEFSLMANILTHLQRLHPKAADVLCHRDVVALGRIESFLWAALHSCLDDSHSNALVTKLTASATLKIIQSATECGCNEHFSAVDSSSMSPDQLLDHHSSLAEIAYASSAVRSIASVLLGTNSDGYEVAESPVEDRPAESAVPSKSLETPSDHEAAPMDARQPPNSSEEDSAQLSSTQSQANFHVGDFVSLTGLEEAISHDTDIGSIGTILAVDGSASVALVRFDDPRGRWRGLWLPLGWLVSSDSAPNGVRPRKSILIEQERILSALYAREVFNSLLCRVAADYAGPGGVASVSVQNWRRRRGSSSAFPTAMVVLQNLLRLLQERGLPEFLRVLAPRPALWQALSTIRECWNDMFALSSPRRAMSSESETFPADDAADAPAVRVSGFLTKQGKMFKQWKKYWCVIDRADPSILTYFKSPESLVPAGLIDLTRVASVEAFAASKDDKKAKMDKLVFHLITDTKSISLGAPSLEEKDKWVSALHESLRRSSSERPANAPAMNEASGRLGRPDPLVALVLEESAKLIPSEVGPFEVTLSRDNVGSISSASKGPMQVEYASSDAALVRLSASNSTRFLRKSICLPGAPHLLIEFHPSSFLADGETLSVFPRGSKTPIGVFSGTRLLTPLVVHHSDVVVLCFDVDGSTSAWSSSLIALVSRIQVARIGSVDSLALGPPSGLFFLSWLLECPASTLQSVGMVPLPESVIWPHILESLTASLAPFGKMSLHNRLIILSLIARLLRRWGDLSTKAMLPAITAMFPAAQELFNRYDDELSLRSGLFSPFLQRLFEVVVGLHSLRLESDAQDDPRLRIPSDAADFVLTTKSTEDATDPPDMDQRTRGSSSGSNHTWFYEMASIAKAIESFALCKAFPIPEARQAFYDAHASEFTSSSSSKSHWPMLQESPHPYPAGVRVTSRVHCPRAKFLIISFDPRSQTSAGSDWLLLSHDRAGGDDLGAFAGTFPPDDVAVRGDSFVWSFISQPDASRTWWGFRFTVTPLFDEDIKHKLFVSVDDDLAALAADHDWSLPTDAALSRVVAEVAQRNGCSYRDVAAADAWKQALDLELSDLVRFGFSSFYRRLTLLKHTNWQLSRLFPLVDLSLLGSSGSIASNLVSSRAIFFLEVKLDLLRSYLASTITSLKRPTVLITRSAFHTECAFFQCYRQLENVFPGALMQPDRCFLVRLAGEGAVDLGGPYQDLLSWICADIASEALGLFIPSPNMARQSGSYQDRLIPSPSRIQF
eukprot:TRINITY_DN4617_c0_g2_i1.p1 TRINITY_DN4617_c0_g2~~TRINITY_DN4617_c0_g2_i1.p1  ORF type:complete len:3411 (-),score=316.58 TRINITY_DN4617_c0_g2_i1:228-10460(-)